MRRYRAHAECDSATPSANWEYLLAGYGVREAQSSPWLRNGSNGIDEHLRGGRSIDTLVTRSVTLRCVRVAGGDL